MFLAAHSIRQVLQSPLRPLTSSHAVMSMEQVQQTVLTRPQIIQIHFLARSFTALNLPLHSVG
jgi:hypothetical protein